MNLIQPKVSIIIPVYNGTNYLEHAINSALMQTYPNIEVLVINDGSTDDGATEKLARSYGDRIRYFCKKNGGVSTALNLGIEMMEGTLFSWLSHDDMYEIDKVEKEVALYLQQENPETVIFSAYKIIDPAGAVTKEYHLPARISDFIGCLLGLDLQYTMNGCTMLIPAQLFKKYGYFRTDLRYTQDYDLWHTFYKAGVPYAYLDKCLMLSRSHDQQGGRVEPIAVTLEADRLHARIVKNLPLAEVEKWLDGDFTQLERYQTVYRNAGYEATALEIESLMTAGTAYSQGRLPAKTSKEKKEKSQEKDKNIWGVSVSKCQSFRSPEELDPTKKTVIFCNQGWYVGGVERVLTNLLPELNERYNMIMLSITDDPSKGFRVGKDIFFAPMSPQHEIPLFRRIALFAMLYHCDVFVGHANITEPFFATYRILQGLGIRTVVMNHYNFFMPYRTAELRRYAMDRDKAFQCADVVLWLRSLDAFAAQTIAGHVGVMVNPNQYSKCPEHQIPREPMLLAVGRFADANKRIDRVFEIFQHVLRQNPDAKLTVVGSFNRELYLPELGITAGECLDGYSFMPGQIIFAGQQKDPALYYQKASVLLMTSNSEGLGMVIVEALSFGVPVVAIRHMGVEEQVQDGYNGYVTNTPGQAANKICGLLTDRDRYNQISAQAQESSKRYDGKLVADKWGMLIDGLTDPRNLSSDEVLAQADMLPDEYLKEKSVQAILKEQNRLMGELALVQPEHVVVAASAAESGSTNAAAPIPAVEQVPEKGLRRVFFLLHRSMKIDGFHVTMRRVRGYISRLLDRPINQPIPKRGLRRWAYLLYRSIRLDGFRITLKRIVHRVIHRKELSA